METTIKGLAGAIVQVFLIGLVTFLGLRSQAESTTRETRLGNHPSRVANKQSLLPKSQNRNSKIGNQSAGQSSGRAIQKRQSKIENRSSRPTPNPELAKARLQVLGARTLGMYYCTSDPRGLKSLQSNADHMTLLGPQSFWLDEQGVVYGEIPPQVVEIARQANLPVMPLVINPHFDQGLARRFLRSPQAQRRAATYLAYLANRDNYVGWQLDLEHIDPADRYRYSQFVALVAARLHQDGRLLSVAVVPRFSDRYPDRSPRALQSAGRQAPERLANVASRNAHAFRTGEWGAPYDYRAIGRLADFVALMTYDHHSEADQPGPVAGYVWVDAAVRYAVARIPHSKLLLGIPFYGREWISPAVLDPLKSGTSTLKSEISNVKSEIPNFKSRSLAFPDAQQLLARPGTEAHWSDEWRTGWFEYLDESGKHTGWYEDSKSLAEKLGLMRRYRLRGFAAWRLGVEDPAFWTLAIPAPSPPPHSPSRSSAGAAAKRKTPPTRRSGRGATSK